MRIPVLTTVVAVVLSGCSNKTNGSVGGGGESTEKVSAKFENSENQGSQEFRKKPIPRESLRSLTKALRNHKEVSMSQSTPDVKQIELAPQAGVSINLVSPVVSTHKKVAKPKNPIKRRITSQLRNLSSGTVNVHSSGAPDSQIQGSIDNSIVPSITNSGGASVSGVSETSLNDPASNAAAATFPAVLAVHASGDLPNTAIIHTGESGSASMDMASNTATATIHVESAVHAPEGLSNTATIHAGKSEDSIAKQEHTQPKKSTLLDTSPNAWHEAARDLAPYYFSLSNLADGIYAPSKASDTDFSAASGWSGLYTDVESYLKEPDAKK